MAWKGCFGKEKDSSHFWVKRSMPHSPGVMEKRFDIERRQEYKDSLQENAGFL